MCAKEKFNSMRSDEVIGQLRANRRGKKYSRGEKNHGLQREDLAVFEYIGTSHSGTYEKLREMPQFREDDALREAS